MASTQPHHRVVVIGSGPAGHTAAIYLARANLTPVMYEGFLAAGIAAGGQLTTTTEIENFPGFPDGLSGPELMDRMRMQSIKFGTTIHTETISRVDLSKRPFRIWKEGSDEKMKMLFWPILSSLLPEPLLSVCLSRAKMSFGRQGVVTLRSEEAVFLTKYATKVIVLVRRDKLRASKVMADRLLNHPKIEIMWNSAPVKAEGDRLLRSLVIENTVTKERSKLDVSGLFYAIGHTPNTNIFKGQVDLHDNGYIRVGLNNNVPSTYTNVEGVFACGDVQDHTYRQAVTAAGSGCMAALDCERWLEGQH
ncbi:hypothetical protein BASA83_003187 [Batrachochytrium salamandrivorans]|nr:hypothetical protein BASA83_003187 [Batrachochytrium salamandrivorans]